MDLQSIRDFFIKVDDINSREGTYFRVDELNKDIITLAYRDRDGDYESYEEIPLEWFLLSSEEIMDKLKERWRKQKEEEEEKERIWEETKNRAREAYERSEYERFKEKFENEN